MKKTYSNKREFSFSNKPIRFSVVSFVLYIGDIEDVDVDPLIVCFLVNDIAASLVDGRIDIELLGRFSLKTSERGNDCFFVSELFKRFNGLWCSCGLVIVNDVGDSFEFLFFIVDELGKLLILYNDKSILSNLSKHWNFESIGVVETNGFTGFSKRGSFIFNGGTRKDGFGIDDGRAFPVSKDKDQDI